MLEIMEILYLLLSVFDTAVYVSGHLAWHGYCD